MNILIDVLIHLAQALAKRFGKRKILSKTFTYRKDGAAYYVGYWTVTGAFISKAEVPSEVEAIELARLLNQYREHD